MRYIALPLVVAAVFAVVVPPAHGQAGKRPDPDSPAGVEYQLPLDQARRNASDGGGDGPRRARDAAAGKGGGAGAAAAARTGAAPLFGAGIAAAGRKGEQGSSETGGGGESGASDRSGSEAAGDRARETSDPDISPSAVAGAGTDDDSATLRIAGIALAVLLAGALLGLGLRRGLRQTGQ